MAASKSDSPFLNSMIGEFHDQNGILGGHGDEHYQGDLGKDVQFEAGAV